MDDTVFQYVASLSDEHPTTRHVQNLYYRQKAMHRLIHSPRPGKYRWLCDERALMAGSATWKQKAWQPTVLMELGRVRDDKTFFELADVLCERKPRAKDGVLLIRRCRLDAPEKHNQLQLIKEIIKAVEDFRKRFPKCNEQAVRNALSDAAWCLFDSDKEESEP